MDRGKMLGAWIGAAIGELADSWRALCEGAYGRLLFHDEPPRDPGVYFTEEGCATVWFAEQMPLRFAGFAYGKGMPDSICATVTMGTDCDSTATAVGFLVGARGGLDSLPGEWIEHVHESNLVDLDLLKMGNDLCDIAEAGLRK